MFENDDDLENIKPDLSAEDNNEPEIIANNEDESSEDNSEEQKPDMSLDDIFAEIPPMPEGYEETLDLNPKFEAQNDEPEKETVFGQDFSHDYNNDSDKPVSQDEETVTVQPVKFASFDEQKSASGDASKNLDNLLDIKLQLTVELGRTTLPVKKVLELTRGSIIELDKIAGEPVELYANGKLIAHGEVVVIEDNFGLRVTSMTEPENRLNGLQ